VSLGITGGPVAAAMPRFFSRLYANAAPLNHQRQILGCTAARF
jgi:hypothetical protein